MARPYCVLLNLFLVGVKTDNVARLLAQSAMAESIGDTKLIEYVDYAADGSYCKLMGWPVQTDLTIKSTKFPNTTLESWYPDTQPKAPSVLVCKPYRIVKTVPLVNTVKPGHPHHGALRYHKDVGWHYQYSMPFRISGKPRHPDSVVAKNFLKSPVVKRWVKKRARKPPLRLKKLAVRLKRLVLSVGLPDLRLRRIDQQPGFGCLLRLLN